jgi:hypothetical protein
MPHHVPDAFTFLSGYRFLFSRKIAHQPIVKLNFCPAAVEENFDS